MSDEIENKKTTIDPNEYEKFSKLAEEWWNPKGKFKTLHKFNPTRIAYIREKIINHFKIPLNEKKPFKDIKLLDIGCGGGLLSEPMARLGAKVTGLDVVEKNIKTASVHAKEQNLKINYIQETIENLAETEEKFDVILNMEVIEHVSDVGLFVKSCNKVLSSNGIMIFATLNRTFISYGLAIIGVEYILGWLPRGTHDWSKFITPDELKILLSSNGLKIDEIIGMKYNPFLDSWSKSKDLSVNYLGFSSKINS